MKWDNESMTPYAYYSNQWVSLDNERSIKLKVDYAKLAKVGAIMVWSIDTDDFLGRCGRGKSALLMTISKNWNPSCHERENTARPDEVPSTTTPLLKSSTESQSTDESMLTTLETSTEEKITTSTPHLTRTRTITTTRRPPGVHEKSM